MDSLSFMSYFFNLITLKAGYWFGACVRQANGNDPLQKTGGAP